MISSGNAYQLATAISDDLNIYMIRKTQSYLQNLHGVRGTKRITKQTHVMRCQINDKRQCSISIFDFCHISLRFNE